MSRFYRFTLLCLLLAGWACTPSTEKKETEVYDVVVLGEGTGAVAAAIQAARSGAKTLLVNPLPWLGGMLTSAGVSATDGNHQLPAGLWGEFRGLLRKHYGGPDSLFTGWVSNTMFEPSVGAQYWEQLVEGEPLLEVLASTDYRVSPRIDSGWLIQVIPEDGTVREVFGTELVDGTDLGDVAAAVGVQYDLGMEARSESGEAMAPAESNDIIQDFTYAAILQDYGEATDHTIAKPASYDSSDFRCSCQHDCHEEGVHPCATMLSYGRLPNDKYMINWPIVGNDYYANMVEMDPTERAAIYQKGKQYTLAFIYYIQQELGFKNLGLAKDEFPTDDHLPLMPYHREGRRIKGQVRLNVNHLMKPFDYELYRTGVAVGDYPIDHHHDRNPEAPSIDFPAVPSFNIPLGALIPQAVDHIVVADKAISVSNIVNGSTRLQPVVLQIGQVAGLLAAMAAEEGVSPANIDVRTLQERLLKEGGYLMPYMDVLPSDPNFAAIQRLGATGILRGKGIPYKWANQTRFYPDTILLTTELAAGLQAWVSDEEIASLPADQPLTGGLLQHILEPIGREKGQFTAADIQAVILDCQGASYQLEQPLRKACVAAALDRFLQAFQSRKVDLQGKWKD